MPDSSVVSTNFYREIPPFTDFGGVSNLSNFHPAPDDWFVVIADIIDSTDAISSGRYKDVNMIGAACITATINAVKDVDIPYVFGGDGATLLIPPVALAEASVALAKLQSLAKQEFDFALRVGYRQIAAIRAEGLEVLVGKLSLSPNNNLAMLTGGGIANVDRLLKEGSSLVTRLSGQQMSDRPDLTGLSCRWEPLRSVHGKMTSILISPLATATRQRASIINQVLSDLQTALTTELETLRPTSTQNMILRWPPRGLRLEAILTRGRQSLKRSLAGAYFSATIQKILDYFNLKLGDFDAASYRDELRTNTDFRRFDDTLRLVLDCSDAQVRAMTEVLEKHKQAGNIRYGIHLSSQALMTCLVFSLKNQEHIHFIDGADGGFAVAAKQMKESG